MKFVTIEYGQGVKVNFQLYPILPDDVFLVLYGQGIAFEAHDHLPHRGDPREDYERLYVCLPQNIDIERAVEIFRAEFPHKHTFGFSRDDGGIGDLSHRTLVFYDVPVAEQDEVIAWVDLYYPGVNVFFKSKPEEIHE